jgi:hypothetical protein
MNDLSYHLVGWTALFSVVLLIGVWIEVIRKYKP